MKYKAMSLTPEEFIEKHKAGFDAAVINLRAEAKKKGKVGLELKYERPSDFVNVVMVAKYIISQLPEMLTAIQFPPGKNAIVISVSKKPK